MVLLSKRKRVLLFVLKPLLRHQPADICACVTSLSVLGVCLTMGGTCVKDEYTLFCPLALQETATGHVCRSNGFSNLETLGKHIRQHCTTKRIVLPNSARATSLAGHQQLFDDCRKAEFLGASPNCSMTRAGVCSLGLLCSTSQYQLFEAGSIPANQVKALPADDPAVWRVICAPAKDTFVLS